MALTAITNYTMPKAILRVAQTINPADVEKLHTAIKQHYPEATLPTEKEDMIWFNPYNGMELPQGQAKPSDLIPLNYLQDKLNRLQSINKGVIHLLNCLEQSYGDDGQVFLNCYELMKNSFKQTRSEIEALAPIDNLDKLKQTSALISDFTHFCNLSLHPILAISGIDFLSNVEPSVDSVKKVQQLLDHAEEFALAVIPRKTVFTISQDEKNNFIVDIAVPEPSYINTDGEGSKQNLLVSYYCCSEAAAYLAIPIKLMLKHLIDTIHANPDELYVASSRADNLPGIRNRWRTGNLLLNQEGEQIFFSETTRMAHLSSRSNEITKEQRRQNTVDNLEQIIQEQIAVAINKHETPGEALTGEALNINLVYSTLVTPLPGFDYQLEQDKKFAVEIALKKYRNKTISINGREYSIQLDIFSLNNAVNYGRAIIPTSNGHGDIDKEYRRLIEVARTAARSDKLLNDLINELENVLNFDRKQISACYDLNRELHMAALVRVIGNRLGWPVIGGCISNKDREALRDIYRKSIEEYAMMHKRVPQLLDAFNELQPIIRNRIVKIYTRRYLNGHEQYLAQTNAPGARGTKTPDIYLPTDIQENIKRVADNNEILRHSEALAKDNDIKKMTVPGQKLARLHGGRFNASLQKLKTNAAYSQLLIDSGLDLHPNFLRCRSSPVSGKHFASNKINLFNNRGVQENNMEIDANNPYESSINAVIKNSLQIMKENICDQLDAGTYDISLRSAEYKDKTGHIHKVPQDIINVLKLIDKIIDSIDSNQSINVDIDELKKLGAKLQHREITPQVEAIHQLISRVSQPSVLTPF